MNERDLKIYHRVRAGETAYYPQKRGLIAVWGKESEQFLNGLITNDVKKLGDGEEMLAAFPNAQGRLVAVVRVRRDGDRFLFETEDATREKVYQNLFRFTFAGEFFVEDLSESYVFRSIANRKSKFENELGFASNFGIDVFSSKEPTDSGIEITPAAYEVLRIESGIPLYGVDMDDTTIVPELGLDGLISYNKGCYIGQEIIARIYFRGHVAKQLRGLVFECETDERELTSAEGKPAGRVTSVCFSPKIGKTIGLGYVRYDFLAEGTRLICGEVSASVVNLPFEV